MYYVTYVVAGFPKTQKAGPWEFEEACSQRTDIASYEGVSNVKLLRVEDSQCSSGQT